MQHSSQKTATMEATQSKNHTGNTKPARVKMIPYIRVETLKIHTLLGGTSTYLAHIWESPPHWAISCHVLCDHWNITRLLSETLSWLLCSVPYKVGEAWCNLLRILKENGKHFPSVETSSWKWAHIKKNNLLFSLFIGINTEINVILYLQWLHFYYTSKFIKKAL